MLKSQSVIEVDQKRKDSPIRNSENECCQRSCPNLLSQSETGSSSNQESREWLVHIDFEPEEKAEKEGKKDIQTIRVTTTRINQEGADTDEKPQSAKEKARTSTPIQESKPQTPAKSS